MHPPLSSESSATCFNIERETEPLALRPLRKQEIDRRIELLIAELATTSGDVGVLGKTDELRPRPITPRELVRRMRPFLVLN